MYVSAKRARAVEIEKYQSRMCVLWGRSCLRIGFFTRRSQTRYWLCVNSAEGLIIVVARLFVEFGGSLAGPVDEALVACSEDVVDMGSEETGEGGVCAEVVEI